MNKKVIAAVLVLVLVTAIFIVVKVKAKDKAPIINAGFTTVTKGSISTIVTATGTIEPLKKVEVGTQVSGVVEKIYVDYNSHVAVGQLLAELDKTNLQASLVDAKASLNTALNELNYLQKIFDRQQNLFNTKLISQADYDEALYKLNNAKGSVEQRQSEVKRAQTNLSYASIYSPIDGIVLSRDVELGQTVAASFSTPTLFTIANDLKQMQVEADVDEADIGQVKQGQRVTFTVDAFLNEVFDGCVSQVRLNATVTSNVVTYTVVIDAQNPKQKLMPGMTATISVYTTELNNVLTLPVSLTTFKPDMAAIMQYDIQNGNMPDNSHNNNFKDAPGNNFMPGQNNQIPANNNNNNSNEVLVWVKRDKRLVPQKIEVGQRNELNVQVVSGLALGDSVLSSINEQLNGVKNINTSDAGSPFMPKPPGKRK